MLKLKILIVRYHDEHDEMKYYIYSEHEFSNETLNEINVLVVSKGYIMLCMFSYKTCNPLVNI